MQNKIVYTYYVFINMKNTNGIMHVLIQNNEILHELNTQSKIKNVTLLAIILLE